MVITSLKAADCLAFTQFVKYVLSALACDHVLGQLIALFSLVCNACPVWQGRVGIGGHSRNMSYRTVS